MNLKNLKPLKTANLPNSIFTDVYKLESYAYHLPEELIAQKPCEQRDHARLMVIHRQKGTITHDTFDHLDQYLPKPVLFVINNSRVIPARLFGNRSTGAAVEIFLLKPLDDGYSYEALLRPLKKIREGESIDLGHGISAVLTDKEKRIVRFDRKDIISHLQEVGHIPLPPYIKRADTEQDREDYQTVYAKKPGSVASPTAGLHFTKEQITSLKMQKHTFLELTLHINYGTFKPVECPDIRDHVMHTEHYTIDRAGYDDLLKAKEISSPVIAVGTTSCRTIESAAQSGILEGTSNIFIYPGFQFKMTDILITNFHLPNSTLLMLVCAFGGNDLIMKAYQEAIKERYRFYSYGDAMLIL